MIKIKTVKPEPDLETGKNKSLHVSFFIYDNDKAYEWGRGNLSLNMNHDDIYAVLVKEYSELLREAKQSEAKEVQSDPFSQDLTLVDLQKAFSELEARLQNVESLLASGMRK